VAEKNITEVDLGDGCLAEIDVVEGEAGSAIRSAVRFASACLQWRTVKVDKPDMRRTRNFWDKWTSDSDSATSKRKTTSEVFPTRNVIFGRIWGPRSTYKLFQVTMRD